MAALSYKSQVYAEDMEEEQVNRAITIAQEAFATNHQGIKTYKICFIFIIDCQQ